MRGYSRLAIDATLGLTSLVEIMHHNILRHAQHCGKAAHALMVAQAVVQHHAAYI